uniref:Uncharacterized protein n=1 Tax=Arundo donax TaxID=35708 RepID=A0A0A9BGT5_ARUDO
MPDELVTADRKLGRIIDHRSDKASSLFPSSCFSKAPLYLMFNSSISLSISSHEVKGWSLR